MKLFTNVQLGVEEKEVVSRMFLALPVLFHDHNEGYAAVLEMDFPTPKRSSVPVHSYNGVPLTLKEEWAAYITRRVNSVAQGESVTYDHLKLVVEACRLTAEACRSELQQKYGMEESNPMHLQLVSVLHETRAKMSRDCDEAYNLLSKILNNMELLDKLAVKLSDESDEEDDETK